MWDFCGKKLPEVWRESREDDGDEYNQIILYIYCIA
jgi:hypothetical protein